jgi:hypothetical protein
MVTYEMLQSVAFSLLMTAKLASAACSTTTYTTCEDNIVHWYDPDTGEVCDPLPCGGWRAPARTDVPGCPAYAGTEIYTPTTSYLSCFTSTEALVEPTTGTTDTTPESEEHSTTSESETAETAETGSVTLRTSGSSTPTEDADEDDGNNGTRVLDGSWVAAAGAVIGAIAML